MSGTMSAKNYMISGSATADLGMGDQLKQQLEDEEEQRKKKLASKSVDNLGPATLSLFGLG